MSRRIALATLTLAAALAAGSCLPAGQSKPIAGQACNDDSECDPPNLVCSDDGVCAGGCAIIPHFCGPGTVCNDSTSRCEVPAPPGDAGPTACRADSQCSPPQTICARGACSPGCGSGGSCFSGWSCDDASGRCNPPATPDAGPDGGVDAGPPAIGATCQTDVDCGPPDLVCKKGKCQKGCTADAAQCYGGWVCDSATGHCHPPSPDAGPGDGGAPDASVPQCTTDSQCAPNVCNQGMCVPAQLPGACTQDMDCAPGSQCTRSGACQTVAAEQACTEETASSCPPRWTCKDSTCFNPGFCATDTDCPASEACMGGLCFPTLSCSAARVDDVTAGLYASGREICVSGVVTSGLVESDGDVFLRLAGTATALALELTPPYQQAGLRAPSGGQVGVVGTVRYDHRHRRWEIQPVKYIQ